MEKKQLRESFVRTIRLISHNVRGLQKDEYVEEMLAWIRTLKDVYAACLQETWKLGDTVEENTGFVLLNHGPEVKLCKRGSLGVAILLSPSAQKAWEKAGSQVLHYGRRIIATRLSLTDNEEREVVVFLVSAYAPIGAAAPEERAEYAQHLQACINECKEHELLVIGTDANAAVGVRSRHDDPHAPGRDVVRGQFGIEHQNNAGRELCGMLGAGELCLPSTFFQQTPGTYGTWRHPCSGLWHQCDHMIVRQQDLHRVNDACSTDSECSTTPACARCAESPCATSSAITSPRERVGVKDLDHYYNTRLLRWVGHVARNDEHHRLPRKLLTCWVRNKRPVGAPQMTYGRTVNKALNSRGITTNFATWKAIAEKRVVWRKKARG
jgi:hypothetical protein